ncbi:hypothetical protein I8D64_09405 [Brachybacterium sp. MASK1Z-5]|uniref:DUF1453 domain-containing protein n=1 Tax=Brachybacterium halotolerans TaxID=2795215 RepID=A0ABS1BBS5_9MICO|nr:hypothetical protein [Brachybacterium halotolerans]MBK0331617.1 hypothetical protein [Brachybacterium halotolerans]
MNASSIPWNALLEGLIVLAMLALILRQQLRWRTVARMQRIGTVLSVIGLVLVLQQIAQSRLDAVSLGYLVLTVAFAIAAGLVMGLVSTVRPGADGSLEMRGGWWGLALWVVYIAVRVGMSIAVVVLTGSQSSRTTGLILVSVGLARLVSAAVATRRPRSAQDLPVVPAATRS